MSRYDRTPFDPAGKYSARRGFTFNGRTYAAGAPFKWRTIACSHRKLKLLFEGGYLSLDGSAKKYDAPKAAKKPAKKKPAKKIAKEKSKVEDYEVKTYDAPVEDDKADDDIEKFLNDQD